MNTNADETILYRGRFFETRLQPGDPPEPPLIVLTLTTPETHQSLVLTSPEIVELPLAAAAALIALADNPANDQLIAALAWLADELAARATTTPGLLSPPAEPAALIVFPTRRSK